MPIMTSRMRVRLDIPVWLNGGTTVQSATGECLVSCQAVPAECLVSCQAAPAHTGQANIHTGLGKLSWTDRKGHS
jgi:hypothetical protein